MSSVNASFDVSSVEGRVRLVGNTFPARVNHTSIVMLLVATAFGLGAAEDAEGRGLALGAGPSEPPSPGVHAATALCVTNGESYLRLFMAPPSPS